MSGSRDDEFTEFVMTNSAQLLRTAWLLTGDRGHGEDLVQTALAKAYAHWTKVQKADNPLAYVRRSMINSHLSWRRRLSNSEQLIEHLPDHGGGDLQAAHAERDQVLTALAQLSPRVRTAIVLRYFDDLTEVSTAELMGCSVSTVNNHVTKGLATLRTLFTPDTPGHLAFVSRRRP